MLKGIFLGWILLSFFGSLNARANQFNLSKDCRLPADQAQSLRAPLIGVMHLIIDSTFDKYQQKSVAAAAAIWNKIGQKIRGEDFFTSEVGPVPLSVSQMTDFDCAKTFGGPGYTYVVNVKSNKIWRQTGLGSSDPGSVFPGVVHYCSYKFQFLQQVVDLNTAIINPFQFRSIALHELGHALGLMHSCQSNPKAASKDYISCENISLSHPYHVAVMYPILRLTMPGSGYPEEKVTPEPNDITRLECLYGPRDNSPH